MYNNFKTLHYVISDKLHLLNLVLVSPFRIPPEIQEILKDRDSLKAKVAPRMMIPTGRKIKNSRKFLLVFWKQVKGKYLQ